MSAVLLLSLSNGKKKIVPCPAGTDHKELAKKHGTSIYQYFESEEQAKLSIERDPTRRAEWV